ncbi:endonuclease III [Candidatus Woesearchaeota archaeon]|nr:endonuclease III [Candidatus Woesearchaeota archaeon]
MVIVWLVEKEMSDNQNKMLQVFQALKKTYPDVKYYLDFKTPLDLLVATILSAQARDEAVNEVTKELFKHYKKAGDYAKASVDDLLKYVGKLSFAGNKSKNIIAACKILAEAYDGQVPKDINTLVELPGIGRKTAIVILTNAFDIVPGVAVDTHVIRVSYRLGWTRQKNPEKIEEDLNNLIPEKNWKEIQWLLKAHGRAICRAQVPFCSECSVEKLCPKAGVAK